MENIISSQWDLEVETSKLPGARKNGIDQDVIGQVLNLFRLEDGESFLDQSQSKVKREHGYFGLFSTLNWKPLK